MEDAEESLSLAVKRMVLDVLKPLHPPVHDFAMKFDAVPHVELVTISVVAIDVQTQTIRLEVEGDDIDYEAIEKVIVDLGGAVHSVDGVTVERRR